MGVAPEDQLAVGIGASGLKVLPVHGEPALFVPPERGEEDLPAGVLGGVEKIAVGGGVEKHLLAGGAQVLRQLIERRNDAGGDAELLLRRFLRIFRIALRNFIMSIMRWRPLLCYRIFGS